ncbi:MAG: YqiA/YcfP family alpha/beta fold hydrolase [Candidatus Cryptobacteroides sp.]
MKILFIHGLASSGAYRMASTLRILFKQAEVIAPDVPIEPDKAIDLLQGICRREQPDLVVGHSLGGYWGQKLRGYRKILINPELHVSRFLMPRIGTMEYLSPRRDGALSFEITESICNEYEEIEKTEFDGLTEEEIALTTGVFADRDELVNCREEFERIYPGRGHSYPGGHFPNFNQIREHIYPIIESIIEGI